MRVLLKTHYDYIHFSTTADADVSSPSPPTTATGKEEAEDTGEDTGDRKETEAEVSGNQETAQSVSGPFISPL